VRYENMERASETVQNVDNGINAVSHEYSVPYATLEEHLDAKNQGFVTQGESVLESS
jgi:hypothetical protein